MLRADEVTVRFRWPGGRWVVALDRASLAVAPGEWVGLLGESGSGKSTLLRTLLGLTRLAHGSVTLAGERLAPRRGRVPRRLRRRLQIVHQDPYASLNPRQRISTILGLPLAVHRGLRGAAGRAAAAELLSQVGLPPEMLDRRPDAFSGGQRQRIAIARALSVEPDYLLLDEPLSALDPAAAGEVLELLHRLRQERNLGLVFVSHDPAPVHALCDRVTTLWPTARRPATGAVSPELGLRERPRA